MKKLAEVTLESDEAEVVFENIPQEYRKLQVYLEPVASSTGSLETDFNEDASNTETYNLRWDDSISTTVSSSLRTGVAFSEADGPAAFTMEIEGYSNNDFKTTTRIVSTEADIERANIQQGWKDDSAIVSTITIRFAGSSVFEPDSKFVLYGVL